MWLLVYICVCVYVNLRDKAVVSWSAFRAMYFVSKEYTVICPLQLKKNTPEYISLTNTKAITSNNSNLFNLIYFNKKHVLTKLNKQEVFFIYFNVLEINCKSRFFHKKNKLQR